MGWEQAPAGDCGRTAACVQAGLSVGTPDWEAAGLRGTRGRAEVTGGGCIFDLVHVLFKEKEPLFGIGRCNLKISISSLS